MKYDKLPKKIRDMRKAEAEVEWREKANNRDQWKRITKVAVRRSDQYISLIPTQGKPKEVQVLVYRYIY